MRLGLAFKSFFSVLRDEKFAARVEGLSLPEPEKEPPKKKEPPIAEQLRLLSILQRDGRLIDFLDEDISAYADDQIGAAVRNIHKDLKASLEKYVELVPVMNDAEGQKVTIPAGFDPVSIRLTGKVTGTAPFKGTVVHRGWKAKTVKVPESVSQTDPLLLSPAEVEVG